MDLIEREDVVGLIKAAVAAEDQKVLDEEPKATANDTKMYGFRYAAAQLALVRRQVLYLPEAAGEEARLPCGCPPEVATLRPPAAEIDIPTATEEVSGE